MQNKKTRRFGEESEYGELLASIFEFMLMGGAVRESILGIAEDSLAKAAKTHGKGKTNRQAGLVTAALVLDAWHRNRRYIDFQAEPKAIALLGSAPSVEALIRAERPNTNAAVIARYFRSLRLVVRVGRNLYKPADRMAVISRLNPLIQQHVARSSSNFLRTIKNNITRPQQSRRLIERFAEVPDLPSSCKKEFQEFTLTQGWAFLKNINDWLEVRRARRIPSRPVRTVRAGVHMYAYIDAGNAGLKKRR